METYVKQLIIVRKDLEMTPGKLAAQVSHASMAFLTTLLQNPEKLETTRTGKCYIAVAIQKDVYEGWIKGIFTKIVCRAKNKNDLMKVVSAAESLGLKEGEDFFLIKDCCLTELTPEETDENGVGRVLTCIGFRPLPDDICKQLSRKYQLL